MPQIVPNAILFSFIVAFASGEVGAMGLVHSSLTGLRLMPHAVVVSPGDCVPDDPCDDGDPCTGIDTCDGGGICVGSPIDCSAFTDFCNEGVCNAGVCEALPINEGGACDDLELCTVGETCSEGICSGGTPNPCDDGIACTIDSCDANECVHTPDDGSCDDGNDCTDDVCTAGVGCEFNNDDTNACDDGDSCTENDSCAEGACGGTAVDCSGLNDECNVGQCNGVTGLCEPQPVNEGGGCNDGLFCTVGDTCTAGVCTSAVGACDDGVACTEDVCNEGSQTCDNVANDGLCNDHNQCTLDTCSPSEGCSHEPNPERTCVDLEWVPVADFLQVGQVFEVRLNARTSLSTNQAISGIDAIISWDSSALKLLGRSASGAAPWIQSGFIPDAHNLNEDISPNDGVPDNDGDAFFQAFSGGNAVVVPAAGVRVTTLRFEALAGILDGPTILSILDSFTNGTGTAVSVVLANEIGVVVTGELGSVALHVCSAGAGDADGDGVDDCHDLCPGTVAGPVGAEGCSCEQVDCDGGAFCCDDGQFCNGLETCLDGVCQPGTTACTETGFTFCDEFGDECVACLVDADCLDGLFCTINEECIAGSCQSEENTCDDGIACTADSCDEGGDACVNTPDDGICDDSNPCTDDACVAGVGCENTPNDLNACTDGDPCTNDACVAGACESAAVECPDDGDPCTALACDPVGTEGNCSLVLPDNEGGPCDDGNQCTDDVCNAGVCTSINIDCSALANQCNQGVCNAVTGACESIPVNEGGFCSDGLLCTFNDRCNGGLCVGTQILGCQKCSVSADCDDGNPCTTGTCIGGGCAFFTNSDPCDDGRPCTINDTCSGGTCAGTLKDCSSVSNFCNLGQCNVVTGSCEALPRNEGVPCDDGLFCTVTTKCTQGACLGKPFECSDGIDCTADACDEELNACSHVPDDGSCDDNNACTDDRCVDGEGCEFTANDANGCDDGDPCTEDACVGGVCVGTPVQCPDNGDTCTRSACDSSGAPGNCDLVVADNEGADCDDEDVCTTTDQCTSGECQGAPVDCSEFDGPCTTGECNPVTGACGSRPDHEGSSCDDGLLCTQDDVCNAGQCVGTPVEGCQKCSVASECDDGNPCTDDECPAGVCIYADNNDPCDDGLACTESDVCSAGLCQGSNVDCSDLDDACNVGTCNVASGLCERTPANEGGECDDLSSCTTGDVCQSGACEGELVDCSSLDDACNEGFCDELTGACDTRTVNEGGECDDGEACTENDSCSLGVCGGSSVDCSGLNDACNVGVCNVVTGACERQPAHEGETCDDGLFCTLGETCSSGSCGGGSDNACSDGVDCTVDSCDELTDGCVHDPNDSLCNDENDCTDDVCRSETGCEFVADDVNSCSDGDPCTDDICVTGVCEGTPVACPDSGNACTVLECNGEGADGNCDLEVPANEGGACDDGDVCTVNDRCSNGECEGDAVDCSGLNDACNVGACDPNTGECRQLSANEGGACDDGILCTANDRCVSGQCVGTSIPNCQKCSDSSDCNDGNSCTDNTCPAGICVFVNNSDPCNDGVPCTENDTCGAGICSGTAVVCSHLNTTCSVGVCNPVTGNCATLDINEGGACSDGNLCTSGDVCVGGDCRGVAIDCSPLDDDCNVGVCNQDSGSCEPEAVNAGEPCDDGVFCTIGERCVDGNCVDGQPNPCEDFIDCTIDSCDGKVDACLHLPDDEACDNLAFCDGVESCDEALGCVPGENPCQTAGEPFCDEELGVCVACLATSDADGNQVVNLVDLEFFVDCMTGPVGPVAPPAYEVGCQCLDADGDGDIDDYDFASLQRRFDNP